MSRQAQRHRSTSLPFQYLDEGLDFDIESYSLDGKKPRVTGLAAGEFTIDIAPGSAESPEATETWEQATLFGTIALSEDVVSDLFPSDEREAPPAKLYVAVRCHETIYRDRVDVRNAPTAPGSYDVKIKLPWENFRGRVELRPYLVRTEERSDTGRYAGTKNAKVASGDRYEIVVDHWDDDEPSMIDGEEASFTQKDYLPGGSKLYYLDFRNEARPKLWINADHTRIADVLRSEGSVGAKPRTRDVVLDQIGYGVWSQLIVRAATAITRSGEVEYEWQQTVLEAFAPELYDVDDVEDAKQLLREDVRDADALGRLVGRIDTELQEYIDPRTQLINLMEEGIQI